MNKFIKQLQDSDKRIAIPIMTHPGIEAIGKKVIDAVTDGEVHYQAIKQVTETYHTTACTVIMDCRGGGFWLCDQYAGTRGTQCYRASGV